jgi:dTDP-D-glucose 4,6-dehydratase
MIQGLDILGDGSQSKSYIYVTDIVNALRTVRKRSFERIFIF